MVPRVPQARRVLQDSRVLVGRALPVRRALLDPQAVTGYRALLAPPAAKGREDPSGLRVLPLLALQGKGGRLGRKE